MANAYRISPGKNVSYITTSGKPVMAKITSVSSQTSAVLAIVGSNGARNAVNTGLAVSKWTAHGQTNVWRPY